MLVTEFVTRTVLVHLNIKHLLQKLLGSRDSEIVIPIFPYLSLNSKCDIRDFYKWCIVHKTQGENVDNTIGNGSQIKLTIFHCMYRILFEVQVIS